MMMISPAYQQLRTPRSKNMALEDGYLPGDHDVICGRGKSAFHHPGNRRFRLVIYMYMDRYQRTHTKLDKSLVVISIVDSFRNHTSGGFVKRNAKKQGQEWIEIGDQLAREKVGHALRDAISARTAEGKQPEGGKFAQTISTQELMEMSPKALERVEKQLKLGESASKEGGVVKSTSANGVEAKRKQRTRESRKVSTCSISQEVSPPVERALVKPKARRAQSDEFSPIRLEDLHKIDLFLLRNCFMSNPPSASPNEGKEEETLQQRKYAEFGAFVMGALSDDEDATPQPPPPLSVLRQSSTLQFYDFVADALLEFKDAAGAQIEEQGDDPTNDLATKSVHRRVSNSYEEV